MHTFDDVLSQIVTLLRRSEAGGFVPHPAKAAETRTETTCRRPAAAGGATGLVSYRDVYSCRSSTWGDGGYVPDAATPATPAPSCHSQEPPTPARPSVKMPFRLFDDS